LAVQRLRTLQEKKEAQAKSSRRDIATLLERGKLETARVKVESLINDDIYTELLELLELHCEMIIARFGLLDQNTRDPDPRVHESVCCIIHAAPRTELKELNVLRELLMHKFGREFSVSVMENRGGCVGERVMSKLTLNTPSPELIDAYLYEIAKGYGITWAPPIRNGNPAEDHPKEDAAGVANPLISSVHSKVEADVKPPKLPDMPPTEEDGEQVEKREKAADNFDDLAKRFEALKKR